MTDTQSDSALQEKKRRRLAARERDRASGDKRNHYCYCGRWGCFGDKAKNWLCSDHKKAKS